MDSQLGNRPRTREAPLAKRLGSQHVSLPSTPKDTRQPGLRIELGDLTWEDIWADSGRL